MILVDICENFHDFGWFFATRLTKMKRIQTDPDPQHWAKWNGSVSATLFFFIRTYSLYSASFMSLLESKEGCLVLYTCFNNFQAPLPEV